MEIIALLFVALTASFLLAELFYRIGLPKVLGPLVFGLLFAQEPLSFVFSGSGYEIITFIKDMAIIFLLFFVGLKIDFNNFKKTSRRSLLVGLLSSLFPFLLGFLAIIILTASGLMHDFIFNNAFLVGLVVGVCLSITAEAVIIEILEELKLLKSLIGETIIESSIIDDIVGIFLISILVTFIPGESGEIGVNILKKFLRWLFLQG